jgi:hypothetical protein
VKGYGEYLYPLSQKTSHCLKGTRILRIYIQILRSLGFGDSGLREFYGWGTVTRRLRVYVRKLQTSLSGHSGPISGNSGLAGNFIRRLFMVGLILMIFIGSLEHNYHINTCGSKSLLIVRYFYTQFQNKI